MSGIQERAASMGHFLQQILSHGSHFLQKYPRKIDMVHMKNGLVSIRIGWDTKCDMKVGCDIHTVSKSHPQNQLILIQHSIILENLNLRTRLSHDLNIVESCYFSMMLKIDQIFHKIRKNEIWITFGGVQRTGNEPSITTVLSYMNTLCSLRVCLYSRNSNLPCKPNASKQDQNDIFPEHMGLHQ